jgi:Uma2 family endonuclease
MDTTILDSDELADRVRAAAESHQNNKDEVWDSVWVELPRVNNEHQAIVGDLATIFQVTIGWTGLGQVRPGVNVSDRVEQWEHNFRCPDVVVYLNGTTARNFNTHWLGGPDFAVEVVSPNDRTREKFGFYAKVGTRELLMVDRDPWILELYRLQDGVLRLVGKSSLNRPDFLISEVLPFSFCLIKGDNRPMIEVAHADGVQRWSA